MLESVEDIDALIDAFSETVEVAGMNVPAIWGNPYVEVPSDETSIGSTDSSALVTPEVADLIPLQAVLIRAGLAYRVSIKEPDETGATVRLVLDRVSV